MGNNYINPLDVVLQTLQQHTLKIGSHENWTCIACGVQEIEEICRFFPTWPLSMRQFIYVLQDFH